MKDIQINAPLVYRVLLATALPFCCTASAGERSENPDTRFEGTFIINSKDRSPVGVIDPKLVTICGRDFLLGTVSGVVGEPRYKTDYQGQSVYIRFDTIHMMQRVEAE